MIAAMSPAASQQQYPMPDDLEERLCPGCKLSVVSEEGGLVVAFGQCFFHVNCFKCAKCHDKVTADTNLLLLSDGSPICANCSYACNVCKQPILDEAIMTGDDAYHAHCFKCKVCKNRIDELVFAKTSQGIYCMDCHNERMIKIRKHTQKKAERERERQAAQAAAFNELGLAGNLPTNKGGSVPTNARDRERRPKEILGKESSSSLQNSRSTEFSTSVHASPYVSDAFEPHLPSILQPSFRTSPTDTTTAPPAPRPLPTRNPPTSEDHSIRPLPSVSIPNGGGLNVTSVREKRRSINPGLVIQPPVLNNTTNSNTTIASPTLSPAGQRSPAASSPTSVTKAPFPSSTRPTSLSSTNSSSNANNHSERARTTSSSSPTTAVGVASLNGDDSVATVRPAPSPLHPTSPYTSSSSRRPDSGSSLPKADGFYGNRSFSPRPGSAASRDRDRPPSRADVPRGVESSTDDDDDMEEEFKPGSYSPQRSMTDDSGGGYSLIDAYASAEVESTSPLYTMSAGEKHDHDNYEKERKRSIENTAPALPPKDRKSGPPAPLSTLPKRSSTLAPGSSSSNNRDRIPISAMSDPPSLTPEPNASYGLPSPRNHFDYNVPHSAGLPVPSMSRNASSSSNVTSGSTSNQSEFSDAETNDNELSSPEDKELLEAEKTGQDNTAINANHATATFIAPALPPIRFSLNTADFSDLFNSSNSLKMLGGSGAGLRMVTEGAELHGNVNGFESVPTTPPSSAALVQPNTLSLTQQERMPTPASSEPSSTVVTPSLPSIPLPSANGSSSSVYASASASVNASVTAVGSMEESSHVSRSTPNSDDGHSSADHSNSNSDYHQQTKKEKTTGAGALLRKVSFGKKSRLERSASSSRKEKKAAAEAMPGSLKNPPPSSFLQNSNVDGVLQANGNGNADFGTTSAAPTSATSIIISPPPDAKPGDMTREPSSSSASSADLVLQRLQEVLADATDRGAQQIKLDRGFVDAIVNAMATRTTEFLDARKQIDSEKRASKQYIDGISVAQTEYDRELKARRDAEAEVTRLRVLLSGQAARLTALTGESRRQELRQKMSKDLNENLNGLERDLSKLKVERDVTLAEVEELNAASSASEPAAKSANLSRTLTKRLDTLKSQYQRELVPLTQQREALAREVMELKAARDVFLEETTVLNARNEELAQLSAQYSRRVAMAPSVPDTPSKNSVVTSTTIVETPVRIDSRNVQLQQQPTPQQLHQMMVQSFSSTEDIEPRKMSRVEDTPTPPRGRLFNKWGGSKTKEISAPILQSGTEKVKPGLLEHTFQPLSLLRFTRCDHCGEKMWGSQLRCSGCNISVHMRCVNQVQTACSHQSQSVSNEELPPSMFGRDLIEQVRADATDGPRKVPVIVEKCIEAVEASAIEYEGIYRKTGGSGQSRMITQLFERGNYSTFDLRDSDKFNDICSVTSVLKSYLRSLPVPLLTHDLHDQFMSAVEIRDVATKNNQLTDLVNSLPSEHYNTVRMLMLHLNRISQRSEVNLMNARNLGVVFGPTLMRSRNPGAEFSDMAGKALTIEWLIESAPQVFNKPMDQ